MKKLLHFLKYLIGIIIVLVILIYALDYNYIFKGIRVTYLKGHKTAYIDDYTEFDNRLIKADSLNPQPWPESSAYNSVSASDSLESLNRELNTAAFLIIKNDSIWFEKYYNQYSANSKTNSFSMAKSVVVALLGKAIRDGYITSIDEPVSHFFPQFDIRLTVGDLGSMSSGLNWDESYYNPFGQTARAYLDDNIRKLILDLEVVDTPGKKFKYLSGNTELLGMVLEEATNKTLSQYLSESFWQPLGMQSNALWQLDSEESGMEKAYCCIASNARNFAKFGKLFMQNGQWNGRRLMNPSFVRKMKNPRFEDAPYYGYGLWLSYYKDKEIFYMRGILGQYVIAIPEDDLIIVRLGQGLKKREGEAKHSPDFYQYIDEAYKMLEEK
ncbi:serine hydrolase domain-containing protein [Zunongwangia endophytica]|uniref:Serine hydrolase domain-containing protein n=1 Tax=Zunongwangia endophytica TaxID=1808945 RepID=A0ABV8H723_9FLAO|nr:serine hydrolase [Zunongwangia endophytica]MDN3595850.1 serine hydrolase [Zunongwangia endophytica]